MMADVHEDVGGEEGGGRARGDGTRAVLGVGGGEDVEGEGLHAGAALVFGEACDDTLVLRRSEGSGQGEGVRDGTGEGQCEGVMR